MTERTLTTADVFNLSSVIDAACQSARVAIVPDDGHEPMFGTARSIGTYDGTGWSVKSDDVRDHYLRVTMRGGWEQWFPVANLAEKAGRGEFLIYDWS